jgi:hypothetical protein
MPIPEISVLWLTAGLSCDGDTIDRSRPARSGRKVLEAGRAAARGPAVAGGAR